MSTVCNAIESRTKTHWKTTKHRNQYPVEKNSSKIINLINTYPTFRGKTFLILGKSEKVPLEYGKIIFDDVDREVP